MISPTRCCAFLSIAALLSWTNFAVADEAGTLTFDSDPGFTITDTGGSASPSYSVRTGDSVGDISLNRDDSFERIFLPLTQSYVGNGSRAQMRIRFAIKPSTGSGADLPMGAMNSAEGNGGSGTADSLTGPFLEGPSSGSGIRHAAGGIITVDSGTDLDALTWYVWDFDYRADPEISNWTLYEGDGSTPIVPTTTGTTSGITLWDQVGFGNTDCSGCDNGQSYDLTVDWLTYAFNDDNATNGEVSLPSDPAYAPDSAIVPEPCGIALLFWGVASVLLSRRGRR